MNKDVKKILLGFATVFLETVAVELAKDIVEEIKRLIPSHITKDDAENDHGGGDGE